MSQLSFDFESPTFMSKNKHFHDFLFMNLQAKHEHQVNTHLRVENDKLRSENMRYKEALENACCPACGFVMTTIGDVPPDERHLRIENARLREEAITYNYQHKLFIYIIFSTSK